MDNLNKANGKSEIDFDSSERDCGPVKNFFRRAITRFVYYGLYRRITPQAPFYTPQAVCRVQGLLSSQSRVFEWGSGASTLWYASRVNELISVEHDPVWYARGLSTLSGRGIKNTKLLFSPPYLDTVFDWQHEWPYYSTLNHAPRKPEFRDYMAQIDSYLENYFHIIAIDGRERVGCLLHALPHLVKGGCLIFDDSHRPKYAEIFDLLKGWRSETHDFGFMQTSLFFSPG